jgi:hypothetical protein
MPSSSCCEVEARDFLALGDLGSVVESMDVSPSLGVGEAGVDVLVGAAVVEALDFRGGIVKRVFVM